MDFGTIFIALIGFTIAMLLFPQFLENSMHNNIDILKENLNDEYDIHLINRENEEYGRAMELWDSLMVDHKRARAKRIKQQKYVPYVSVLIVLEVTVFAYSSYKIARGQKMPGFIEDLVIGLAIVLVGLTIYTAYKTIKDNQFFGVYLSHYEEFVSLHTGQTGDSRRKNSIAGKCG